MAFVGSAVSFSAPAARAQRQLANARPVATQQRNKQAARMVAVDAAAVDAVISASDVLRSVLVVAAEESDFGGYVGPAIGLLSIGAIILALAPPLKDN